MRCMRCCAVLCAAGYNIRWLLRAIVRLRLTGFFAPLLALLVMLTDAFATATRAGQRLESVGPVALVNFAGPTR
jgi:hypothetical protein